MCFMIIYNLRFKFTVSKSNFRTKSVSRVKNNKSNRRKSYSFSSSKFKFNHRNCSISYSKNFMYWGYSQSKGNKNFYYGPEGWNPY